ncbi:MAG: hypothetical protein M3016_09880 [Actinomycetota bacterium]|nr:hypothetical protein [Actinomycetota bacterium]
MIVPRLVAALVLALAGLAKLRSPQLAARAGGVAPAAIRALAAAELAVAASALVSAAMWSAATMAALYTVFSVITLRLARAGEDCGCFGSQGAPASPLQSLLSAALAGVCLLSAIAEPPAAGWILSQSPATAAVVALGAVATAYGIVLAYSELPSLWRSWSPAS